MRNDVSEAVAALAKLGFVALAVYSPDKVKLGGNAPVLALFFARDQQTLLKAAQDLAFADVKEVA